MRFEVGSQVPFIHVKFQFPNGFNNADGLSFMRYLPWESTLLGIDILLLTCTERHDVPTEDCETQREDGFVFKDHNGNVWHNEYPFSSGAPMQVERHFTNEDQIRSELEKGERNFEMKALSAYLAEVTLGIFDIRFAEAKGGTEEADFKASGDLLQAHYDEVVSKYEAESGKKVVKTERIFGKGEFSGGFRGYYTFRFVG
jgi:hypothetical protein